MTTKQLIIIINCLVVIQDLVAFYYFNGFSYTALVFKILYKYFNNIKQEIYYSIETILKLMILDSNILFNVEYFFF
jgi:hypothetical protein